MIPPVIYLDHNATTAVAPEVMAAMEPFWRERFGNPSCGHAAGSAARDAVEQARIQAATFLNCHPDELVFTSGGTEAANHALRGAAYAHRGRGNRIVISAIEHPAVEEACMQLEREGFHVTRLPVDEHGLVSPEDLARAMNARTILVSVMHANNEVGTVQPIAELAALARRRGAVFHTDAAQAPGRLPVDLHALGADLASLSGHKFHAPKGVGALYLRREVAALPLLRGGEQEGGRRAGTENVPAIVGFGVACELAGRTLADDIRRMESLRVRLAERLLARLPAVRVNGHPRRCLPNTLSLSLRGVDATVLLARVGQRLAITSGSACRSGQVGEISPVLSAMRVPDEWARGTLRFSLGRYTTEAEIDEAAELVAAAVKRPA